MNIEFIKDTNNYKHYKKMIKFTTWFYLGTLFLFVPFALIMMLYDESFTILSVVIIVFMSIWYWISYFIFKYNINKIIKNKDAYILSSGRIKHVLSVKGKNFIHYKRVVIESEKLNKVVTGDLLKGETFKTIKEGQGVEFLYNPLNNHVLIINSLYNI